MMVFFNKTRYIQFLPLVDVAWQSFQHPGMVIYPFLDGTRGTWAFDHFREEKDQ